MKLKVPITTPPETPLRPFSAVDNVAAPSTPASGSSVSAMLAAASPTTSLERCPVNSSEVRRYFRHHELSGKAARPVCASRSWHTDLHALLRLAP